MSNFFQRLAPVMALSLPLLAAAQQATDPADGTMAARPLRYPSAFADYKPWQDIKPGDWRQLNDNLRPAPAAAPAPAASAPRASAPTASAPTAPMHQGHPMHGGRP